MIKLSDIPFSLDAERLKRELRVKPGTSGEPVFEDLLAQVVAVGRPKALYDECFIEDRDHESVTLGGVRFTSRALSKNLEDVERAFPYVVTCGIEADAVKVPEDDHVQGFWIWSIKEALLREGLDYFREYMATRYRLVHTGDMQPGAADAGVWAIEQQENLFSLFGDVEGQIGVRLTPSMLMIPAMSVSGIIYPTEADFESCRVCHREGCSRRRAPFDEALWAEVCAE